MDNNEPVELFEFSMIDTDAYRRKRNTSHDENLASWKAILSCKTKLYWHGGSRCAHLRRVCRVILYPLVQLIKREITRNF